MQRYHDDNCQDKEIVANIERAISASLALRDKRDLIETFIATMSAGKDASDEWRRYVLSQMRNELEVIISEENLRPDETRAFVRQAFEEGNIQEDGTDITRILRPMSRFGKKKGVSRAESKARVVERLRGYFDRFYDIAPKVTYEYLPDDGADQALGRL